jgi:hypothetical protein
MTNGRGDALLRLLPPASSPYSFDKLSSAETAALEEALGDGYGDRDVVGSEPFPLPGQTKSGQNIDAGLLNYSFFAAPSNRSLNENDDREKPDAAFWITDNEYRLAPSELCPLEFDVRRLKLYFDNQLTRFRKWLAHDDPLHTSIDDDKIRDAALARLFEKPWYEFHINKLICFIMIVQRDPVKFSLGEGAYDDEDFRYQTLSLLKLAGQLGRLVEQYYWRFRFEKAAIGGIGAREGAALGGKLKSANDKALQSGWQQKALDIWRRHPEWTKMAVATEIKKRTNQRQSAKHIARYIRKPAS